MITVTYTLVLILSGSRIDVGSIDHIDGFKSIHACEEAAKVIEVPTPYKITKYCVAK